MRIESFFNFWLPSRSSPLMEQINEFHDFFIIILIFIFSFLTLIYYCFLSNKSLDLNFIGHEILEVVWSWIPIIILLLLAFPSIQVLFIMEEMVKPVTTIKITGNQWYWTYNFTDFLVEPFDSAMVKTNILRLFEVDFFSVLNGKISHFIDIFPLFDKVYCNDEVVKYIDKIPRQHAIFLHTLYRRDHPKFFEYFAPSSLDTSRAQASLIKKELYYSIKGIYDPIGETLFIETFDSVNNTSPILLFGSEQVVFELSYVYLVQNKVVIVLVNEGPRVGTLLHYKINLSPIFHFRFSSSHVGYPEDLAWWHKKFRYKMKYKYLIDRTGSARNFCSNIISNDSLELISTAHYHPPMRVNGSSHWGCFQVLKFW